MALTRAEVEKVALLGRLELSETELVTMTEQLGQIVSYIELLSELDTEAVEPLAHTIGIENVFREDVIRPSFERAEMLANAPRSDGEFYLVPPVLD